MSVCLSELHTHPLSLIHIVYHSGLMHTIKLPVFDLSNFRTVLIDMCVVHLAKQVVGCCYSNMSDIIVLHNNSLSVGTRVFI